MILVYVPNLFLNTAEVSFSIPLRGSGVFRFTGYVHADPTRLQSPQIGNLMLHLVFFL